MFNTDKLFQALKRITELEWFYQKENDTVKKLTQQIDLANKKHAAEMMSLKGDIKVCKNDRDKILSRYANYRTATFTGNSTA